jgi:hypothetical protein
MFKNIDMELLNTHPIKKSDLGFHGNLFGGKLLFGGFNISQSQITSIKQKKTYKWLWN